VTSSVCQPTLALFTSPPFTRLEDLNNNWHIPRKTIHTKASKANHSAEKMPMSLQNYRTLKYASFIYHIILPTSPTLTPMRELTAKVSPAHETQRGKQRKNNATQQRPEKKVKERQNPDPNHSANRQLHNTALRGISSWYNKP
jgi:hypothetical protein